MNNKDRTAEAEHIGRQGPPKRYALYFAVLLLVIVLVDILDNLATNIGANITSSFITEFFVNGKVFGKSYAYEEGLALHNTISLIGYVIALLAPFYKSLADKIGRKPLFVLSSLGMSAGLLVIFMCRSYLSFLIGSFMLSFFIGSDIQILYVLEEAPKDKRATVYSLLKGIGGLSAVAIPAMRATLMHNDPTRWRSVYLLPGLYGLAVTVLIVLLAKETRVYQENRQAKRRQESADRQDASGEKKAAPAGKSGVVTAVKYIFRHRDLRTLILIKMLFDAAIVAMRGHYHGGVLLSLPLLRRGDHLRLPRRPHRPEKDGPDLRPDLCGLLRPVCPQRKRAVESCAGRHLLRAIPGRLLDRERLYGDHLHGNGADTYSRLHHGRRGASGLYRNGRRLCFCQHRHPVPAAVAGLQRLRPALHPGFRSPAQRKGEGDRRRGL